MKHQGLVDLRLALLFFQEGDAFEVLKQGWPQKSFSFQQEDSKAFYFGTTEEEVRVFRDVENEGYYAVEGRLVNQGDWDDWDIFSKEEVQAYLQKANEAKFNVAQNQHRYINTLPSEVQVLVEHQVQQNLVALGYQPEELVEHVERAMASRLSDVEEVVDYKELQEVIDKQREGFISAKYINKPLRNKGRELDCS